MYRCNDNVGCLSVETFPIGENLEVSAFPVSEKGFAETFRLDVPLIAECYSMRENVCLDAFELSRTLDVSCFPICSLNKEFYLKISLETVWLTYDNGWTTDVEINSNVQWIIN